MIQAVSVPAAAGETRTVIEAKVPPHTDRCEYNETEPCHWIFRGASLGENERPCFVLGAMASAVMVNFARRRGLYSEYALPLLVEAALLLGFGLAGGSLQSLHGLFVPGTVMLLCFIMGLQNAVISKISRSEIRTTHITGTMTDIGIELGKLLYWNRPQTSHSRVLSNRRRLRMLSLLATSFFVGGVTGAVGFRHVGYLCTVPLAMVLVALACVPALDDVGAWLPKLRRR